jgi:hypothetical protein
VTRSTTYETYEALTGVRWSQLKHLWQGSPRAFRHALNAERVDRVAWMKGRACHCLVLTPDRWDDEFVVWTGGTRRGKAWDAFEEANAGRTIVKADEHTDAAEQAVSVWAHPEARKLLEGAEFEVVIQWIDEATGIPCKAMIDCLHPVYGVVDLKGCRELARFGPEAYRLGYQHQAAFYRRGVKATRGLDVGCSLIAHEFSGCHDVGVWTQPEGMTEVLDRDISNLLARLAECEAADEWPGRYPDVVEATIPAWAVDEVVDETFEAFGDVSETDGEVSDG